MARGQPLVLRASLLPRQERMWNLRSFISGEHSLPNVRGGPIHRSARYIVALTQLQSEDAAGLL